MYKISFFILILFQSLHAKLPFVPYEEAFDIWDSSPCQNTALYKSFYESYHNIQEQEHEDFLIPPLIHFIWLGSRVPERVSKMVDSWRRHHPEWVIIVWTDNDTLCFDFHNQEAFDRATNWGEKSDIFRYEILFRFGGLYADIDFECLQPFDSLHKTCDLYAGVLNQCCLPNGIIGARPGHPVMKQCIQSIKVGVGDNNLERIMEETGPYFFTKAFTMCADSCTPGKTLILPPRFFFPCPPFPKEQILTKETWGPFTKPESMAVHHWFRSWQ